MKTDWDTGTWQEAFQFDSIACSFPSPCQRLQEHAVLHSILFIDLELLYDTQKCLQSRDQTYRVSFVRSWLVLLQEEPPMHLDFTVTH